MTTETREQLIFLIKTYRLFMRRKEEASVKVSKLILKHEISDQELFEILQELDPDNEAKARGALKAIKNQIAYNEKLRSNS